MSKDAAGSPPPSSIIILDLGGHTAKLGLASSDDPRLLPNCIYKAKSEKKRQFISSQITECKDQHQLFHMYPFTGGFLTNWELQERLLDYFFGEEVLNVDTAQSHIILTEPYFNLQSLKRFVNEALFEGKLTLFVLRRVNLWKIWEGVGIVGTWAVRAVFSQCF